MRRAVADDEPGRARAGAPPLDAFVVPLGEEARLTAATLATVLRRAGIRTGQSFGGRGVKGAMKSADRSGAAYTIVIGERELAESIAQVKDMDSGEQTAVAFDDLVTYLEEHL